LLLDVAWNWGPFLLTLWTGFFLGILHTLMPCEDKFIFCFYAFGVSRDWKQAFRIVNFYGFGLFLTNFIIGAILSYISSIVGLTLKEDLDNYKFLINAISGSVLIISGLIMIFQIIKKKYWPHSDQLQELIENLPTLRSRKRTGFLLGVLAGIPPCIFEIAIYSYASLTSATNGWGNGVWIVFFFGIGTWLGLIPLAILGTMSGKFSKFIQNSSMSRFQFRTSHYKKEEESLESGAFDDNINDSKPGKINFTLEIISAGLMVTIGFVFLILAILQINIIPIEDVPNYTWPFNEDNVHYFWIGALILFIFGVLIFIYANHVKKSEYRDEKKFIDSIKKKN